MARAPAAPGGARQEQHPAPPPAMLAHHPRQAAPVGTELATSEGERVAEAMPHDHLARDAGLGAGLGKAPAQLDVLARLEGRVEAVLEQVLAVEDRRHQPEPVPAAT